APGLWLRAARLAAAGRAVEVAERFADGLATRGELQRAFRAGNDLGRTPSPRRGLSRRAASREGPVTSSRGAPGGGRSATGRGRSAAGCARSRGCLPGTEILAEGYWE